MATLTFDQKKMLLAYKTFYGEPYIAPSSQKKYRHSCDIARNVFYSKNDKKL